MGVWFSQVKFFLCKHEDPGLRARTHQYQLSAAMIEHHGQIQPVEELVWAPEVAHTVAREAG